MMVSLAYNRIPVDLSLSPRLLNPKQTVNKTISLPISTAALLPAKQKQYTINVSGKLLLQGSSWFGAVCKGSVAERELLIINSGNAVLTINNVQFRYPNPHWQVLHTLFPTALAPQDSLRLILCYRANEAHARQQQIMIHSTDLDTPIKLLAVTAYTLHQACACLSYCTGRNGGDCDLQHKQCHQHLELPAVASVNTV